MKQILRFWVKDKWVTIINIAGLTLALTSCLLIVLYTVNELSYDRYNRNFDRIYRVNSELKYGETVSSFAIAAPPVAAGLKDNFPEVEQSARLTPAGNIRFKRGNESILEERAAYADTEIFDVFTLPLISGNPETALAEPNSVVINESIAYKYFNRKDVVGKTLIMAPDKSPRKITGVMRNMPSQSHFNYDLFLTFPESHSRYNSFAYSTYLLVKPGTDYKKLEAKFRPFIARSLNAPDFNNDEFEKGGNYIRINLTPLGDIHLKSNLQRELAPNGDIQYVYIFSIIALFILIIACINFINLSTARAAIRSKEVGIRKVLGSTRIKLIGRFISESALMAIFASAAAIVAVWMLTFL